MRKTCSQLTGITSEENTPQLPDFSRQESDYASFTGAASTQNLNRRTIHTTPLHMRA